MIPAFNISGVLPPYVGSSPTEAAGRAPYQTTMREIATRLCTSKERVPLLRGLVQFRKALQGIGITSGFQWIDGSFCEDVEGRYGRPPGDVDVVTFFIRPPAHRDAAAWTAFVLANRALFDKTQTKPRFGCEAFFVDVGLPPPYVVPQTTYWYGLFSHQRVTHVWKGILLVPMISDDDDALAHVNELTFP